MCTNYSSKWIESCTRNSGNFTLSSVSVILKKHSTIHNYQGKNFFNCHVFRNLWIIKWLCFYRKKSFFITNSKCTSAVKKIWAGDFLELWQYDLKNNLKKNCTLYFSNLGEIWEFECNIFYKFKKKSNTLVICYGFKLFFFNLPFSVFQLGVLKKGTLSISLISIYQWKMDCNFFNIITGDIYGNIIIYNFSKKFSILRIFYNSIQKIPISTIGTFLKDFPTKIRFIISGGYDSFIKIWDKNEPTNPIVCICISKKRVVAIFANSHKFWNGSVFVCFENGFCVYWNLFQHVFFGFKFFHQIGIWKIFKKSTSLLFTGENGTGGILKSHFPFSICKKILLSPVNKYFFSNICCINRNWNFFQSFAKTFSLYCAQISLLTAQNYIFSFGGNRGVIFLYKYKLSE